jgi:hypothetical protein
MCGRMRPPGAPPPRPKPAGRYQATVRSIHPGAVVERSRNWTYRGDTVRVAFRNATAVTGERQRYTVCYTRNRSVASRAGPEPYEAGPETPGGSGSCLRGPGS